MVPADPLLADPALVAPAPGDSAPTDLLALDPVSLDPALTDPALTEALLTDPVPVAGGVLSVGLLPVPPPAGGLDGGNTVVGELLKMLNKLVYLPEPVGPVISTMACGC